jgi:hypothetical protein
MILGKYRFSCVLEDDAHLPEYKGSTFRGVFGHALKKVVCALRKQTCHDCLLKQKCVYAFVFESIRDDDLSLVKKRIAAPPHAYVIEPPLETRTNYIRGESFEFTLLLFGKANEYLPYFIYAIEQVGESGIGKRIYGKAAQFLLESVSSNGQVIYSHSKRNIKNIQVAREIPPESFTTPDIEYNGSKKLRISMRTPLRLKYHSQLEPDLPFHILVRASLRRISSLFTYHGDGEPQFDYRGLVKRAVQVETIDTSIRWYDWRRYSNRQEQAMFMGGMMGEVVYGDVPREYIPLLKFCEEVHLGKQTTFGLGKFTITIPDSAHIELPDKASR